MLPAVLFAIAAAWGAWSPAPDTAPPDVHLTVAAGLPALARDGAAASPTGETVDHWYTDGQAAVRTAHAGLIVDLDAKTAYVIDHDEQFYVAMDLPLDFTAQQARSRMLPETAAEIAGRLPQATAPAGENRVVVTPTKTKARIGRWTCTAYDVSLSDPLNRILVGRFWATSDLPKDVIKAVTPARAAILQAQFRISKGSLRELQRIKGVIVAIEWNRGVPGATQVTDIAPAAAPPGTFRLPAGYARRPLLPGGWTWR